MMLSVIIRSVCSVPSSSARNWMGLACVSRIVRNSRLPVASSASLAAKNFLRSLYSSWISRCTCCSMLRMALCRFFIRARLLCLDFSDVVHDFVYLSLESVLLSGFGGMLCVCCVSRVVCVVCVVCCVCCVWCVVVCVCSCVVCRVLCVLCVLYVVCVVCGVLLCVCSCVCVLVCVCCGVCCCVLCVFFWCVCFVCVCVFVSSV